MSRSIKISLGVVAVVATSVLSSASAQSDAGLSAVDFGVSARIDGLADEQKLVSYTIQTESGRQEVNIGDLATEANRNKLNYRSDTFLEDLMQAFPYEEDRKPDQILGGLEAISSALHDGGMHALAAEEMTAFIQGAAQCIDTGGVLWPQVPDENGDLSPRPRLIRSEMDLHFNVGQMPNESNFGRGQLDVGSIKLLMCIKAETPADSYSIIVDRRWVINVGEHALRSSTDQRFPPNDPAAPVYPFRLSANGNGIELVSYYVSGVRQPYTDPIYNQSPNACIDIFFNIVPQPDQHIMISKPGDLVFCAGGACGDRPPKLDATH